MKIPSAPGKPWSAMTRVVRLIAAALLGLLLVSGFVPTMAGIPLDDNGDIVVLVSGHQPVIPLAVVWLLPIAVAVFLVVLSRTGRALIRRTAESRTHLEPMRERRDYVSNGCRFTLLFSADSGTAIVYDVRVVADEDSDTVP